MGNKLEQEVKFYLHDLKALEEKLITLGASLRQPRTYELNLRFDTPDRRLSAAFQALRLRQDNRARLTYKGASDPLREISARAELEVEVSDLSTARAILEALGYEVVVSYEKFRAAYLLEDVEISLDEMPFGNFCEIEGPDSESIRKCAQVLKLDWEKRSKLSYLALFGILKEKMHLDVENLSFNEFTGLHPAPDDFGLEFAN